MSVETVNCNECGALIQVPSTAKYCTCTRCGEHLVVHRSDVAAYTEALPRRDDRRGPADDRRWRELEGRLDDLAYENALMRLDREWDRERERYMMYGRYGRRYQPNATLGIVFMAIGGAAALAGVSVALLVVLSSRQPAGLVCLFPAAIFTLAFGLTGLLQYLRGKQYQAAYDRYLRRREAVERGWDDPGEPPPERRPSYDDED
jgi:hypothetical protein